MRYKDPHHPSRKVFFSALSLISLGLFTLMLGFGFEFFLGLVLGLGLLALLIALLHSHRFDAPFMVLARDLWFSLSIAVLPFSVALWLIQYALPNVAIETLLLQYLVLLPLTLFYLFSARFIFAYLHGLDVDHKHFLLRTAGAALVFNIALSAGYLVLLNGTYHKHMDELEGNVLEYKAELQAISVGNEFVAKPKSAVYDDLQSYHQQIHESVRQAPITREFSLCLNDECVRDNFEKTEYGSRIAISSLVLKGTLSKVESSLKFIDSGKIERDFFSKEKYLVVLRSRVGGYRAAMQSKHYPQVPNYFDSPQDVLSALERSKTASYSVNYPIYFHELLPTSAPLGMSVNSIVDHSKVAMYIKVVYLRLLIYTAQQNEYPELYSYLLERQQSHENQDTEILRYLLVLRQVERFEARTA